MIDLSSLAASMTNPVMKESGPSSLSALSGGATAGSGSTTALAGTQSTAAAQPSTDGFMQVLDLFLGGSPLPSTLLASTAITQTPSTDSVNAKTLDTGALLAGTLADADQPQELDAATAERIASVLQMLGFQVKPSEIQELSPLDREQLGTALEFVQRNLQRGANPGAIAENASLLLPRDWPLDDADGSPLTNSDTSLATDSNTTLPAGFADTLSELRAKIHASLGQGATETKHASTDATANPAAVVDAKSLVSAQAGSGQGDPSSFKEKDSANASLPAGAKKSAGQDLSVQWNQQLQQANVAAPASDVPATGVPRHLAPGGTTSELIGRQVLEKVHVQLNEGHREVKLRLWPEELGEVRLSLKMTDGEKVHANMVVENDAVRQAMLDATPQLKDALAKHGLDLERLSVSVSQKDAQEAGSDGGQGGKEQRQGGRNGRGNGGWNETQVGVAQELVMGEDTGMRNGRNTIDLWS